MTRSEPASHNGRGHGSPPKWVVVSLLAVGIAVPLLPALALAMHADVAAENFGALMAAAAGIGIASLSALGAIYGRIHISVSVHRESEQERLAIDGEFIVRAPNEASFPLPVEAAQPKPDPPGTDVARVDSR